MLRVLAIVAVILGAARAHADTIALLPLDAEKRLEIYGQPVAAEIGRALKAQGYDVVVVGAKMDVPDGAQLIVDGTIKSEKASAISLSIRIRDPKSGSTLQTLPASAQSLTQIDKAAADLSTRLVPAVKTHLEALAKAAEEARSTQPTKPDPPVVRKTPAAPPPNPPVVVAVGMPQAVRPKLALLASGLVEELPGWSVQHKRQAHAIEPAQMSRKSAAQSVLAANASVGIAFEVLTFSVRPGVVPTARARVRVRVVNAGAIVFERVVRTDTIVGDRGISEQKLAARTAREVLAITNAQLRKVVGGWR